MNRALPPPAAMWRLPGPWQDSHPACPAIFAPSICSRAWALPANARVMFVWHSKQALLPTKLAPSIKGTSTILRWTVEQEETTATTPPNPTNKNPRINPRPVFIRPIDLWLRSDPIVCNRDSGNSQPRIWASLSKALRRFKRIPANHGQTRSRGDFGFAIGAFWVGLGRWAGPARVQRAEATACTKRLCVKR